MHPCLCVACSNCIQVYYLGELEPPLPVKEGVKLKLVVDTPEVNEVDAVEGKELRMRYFPQLATYREHLVAFEVGLVNGLIKGNNGFEDRSVVSRVCEIFGFPLDKLLFQTHKPS